MDFTNAALVIAAIFGTVEFIKRVWAAQPVWAPPVIAVAVGIGAMFLLGGTVWAHQEVIGGHALDNLNASSKVVAGVFAGFLAVGLNEGVKMVKSVGQNQP